MTGHFCVLRQGVLFISPDTRLFLPFPSITSIRVVENSNCAEALMMVTEPFYEKKERRADTRERSLLLRFTNIPLETADLIKKDILRQGLEFKDANTGAEEGQGLENGRAT